MTRQEDTSRTACATASRATSRTCAASSPTAMYDMVLSVVEKPLLEVVMTRAEGNQSRAAEWLGINRNTLRKQARRAQADQVTRSAAARATRATPMQALISVSDKTGLVDFARALRGARRRAALHRRHRASCSPRPASPVTEVADVHRLSGDARRPREDAAPEVHGGLLARRDLPAHMAALAAARHRARSTCWWSTSTRSQADGRQARLHARRRDREHRHRRPGDAARGGEELAATSRCVTDPAHYAGVARRAAGGDGARQRRDALRARRARRSPTPPPTTARSATTCPSLRRRRRRARARVFPAQAQPAASSSCRTCATARTRTSRRVLPRRCSRRAGALADYRAAAGQGALLQQHRRRRRGLGMRQELRRAGLRHRQARQPLRRGDRRRRRSRPTQGVRDRPDLGLRRHHRLQPRARRRRRRGGRASSSSKC